MMLRVAFVSLILLAGGVNAVQAESLAFDRCENPRLMPDVRIGACKTMIARGSQYRNLPIDLGDAYRFNRDYPDAIAAYSLAVQPPLDPFPDAHGRPYAAAFEGRALAYLGGGQYDNAMADADSIIKVEAGSADALSRRCWIRAVAGKDLDGALSDCNAALESDPENAHALDALGFVLFRRGDLKAAIADYDATLDKHPKTASSLYMRGIAKHASGDATGGDADIASAKELEPYIADEFVGYGVKP